LAPDRVRLFAIIFDGILPFSGQISLLRAHASAASTLEDRSRATALVTGGVAIGLAMGPGQLLSFAHLPSPPSPMMFSLPNLLLLAGLSRPLAGPGPPFVHVQRPGPVRLIPEHGERALPVVLLPRKFGRNFAEEAAPQKGKTVSHQFQCFSFPLREMIRMRRP
jgi:hypothetical protein